MTQRRKKLQQIIQECFKELYKEAEPSANFEELIESAPLDEQGRKVIAYENYYLSEDKFEEIVNRFKKKMIMNKYEELTFNSAIYLGPSPTSKNKL